MMMLRTNITQALEVWIFNLNIVGMVNEFLSVHSSDIKQMQIEKIMLYCTDKDVDTVNNFQYWETLVLFFISFI